LLKLNFHLYWIVLSFYLNPKLILQKCFTLYRRVFSYFNIKCFTLFLNECIWVCVVFMLQRITATVNTQEQKRLLMDMDICKQSSDCPYTVQFYGALFREGDVWICMEVMDTSLDKFSAKVCHHGRQIPEDILGKIAFAVSFPLLFNYV